MNNVRIAVLNQNLVLLFLWIILIWDIPKDSLLVLIPFWVSVGILSYNSSILMKNE